MAVYLYLERFMTNPTIPWEILSNRTSAIGYITTTAHSIVSLAVIYYLPQYFQAVTGASPVASGVDLFSVCFTIAPMAMIGGGFVTATARYKELNIAGWAFITLGTALMTIPNANTNKQVLQGVSALAGIGLGCLYSGLTFVVIAPLKSPSQQAQAVSGTLLPTRNAQLTRSVKMIAFVFTRNLGQILGIATAGTVLTSGLSKRLPTAFAGGDGNIALSLIPSIKTLSGLLSFCNVPIADLEATTGLNRFDRRCASPSQIRCAQYGSTSLSCRAS